MDTNQQVFIFILFGLLILLIYIMKPSKNNVPVIKLQNPNSVDTLNQPIINNKKPKKKIKHNGKFELWENQWLSRATQTKQCYNRCRGLRTNDYKVCIDNCVENTDRFFQNMVNRPKGNIKAFDPNYLKI